jgi:hypothetical protein
VLVPTVKFLPYEFYGIEDLHRTHEQPQNIILIATCNEDQKVTGERFRGIVRSLGERGFYPYELYGNIRYIIDNAGTIEEFSKVEMDLMDRIAKAGGKVGEFVPLVSESTPVLTDEYSPVDVWSGFIMLHAE